MKMRVRRMDTLSKIAFTTLLLCITIFMMPAVQGAGLDYPNRYGKMAEGMLDMMDAFASASGKRRGEGQQPYDSDLTGHRRIPGNNPPPGNVRYPGNRPGYPGMIPRAPGQYSRSRLDGNWQGKTGEIFVIRSGRFRIYQNAKRYHEGLIYLDEKHLAMQQRNAAVTHRFEYAEKGGRLVLRDNRGNLLLYRKIN